MCPGSKLLSSHSFSIKIICSSSACVLVIMHSRIPIEQNNRGAAGQETLLKLKTVAVSVYYIMHYSYCPPFHLCLKCMHFIEQSKVPLWNKKQCPWYAYFLPTISEFNALHFQTAKITVR